jgi:PAS domain S-box-containing protein
MKILMRTFPYLFSVVSISILVGYGWIQGVNIFFLILTGIAWGASFVLLFGQVARVNKIVNNGLKLLAVTGSVQDKNEALLEAIRTSKNKLENTANQIRQINSLRDIQPIHPLIATDDIGVALKQVQQEISKLKHEEDHRHWIAEGLAKFGELLRRKDNNDEFYNRVISSLVRYVGGNQGGFFLYEESKEEGQYLELVACYAYERQRFQQKRIYAGQGILGQSIFERDIIFLTDVPKDYIKITSGLGLSIPRNIVVVPLIINQKFYGAIELASFEILQPYQIEFLKEVSENIASELDARRNLQNTNRLLEDSKNLTNELQSSEEELKRNLTELAVTQEKMKLKQVELTGLFDALDATIATIEFSPNGTIINHNGLLQNIFGYTAAELMDRDHSLFFSSAGINFSWLSVLSGKLRAGDFLCVNKMCEEIWVSATFTPVKDERGEIVKVLSLVQNITQKRSKEIEFERLSLVANNTDNSVIITNGSGLIEFVNQGFTAMTGYTLAEVFGKKPGNILQGDDTDKETILRISSKLKSGEPIYEEILNYNKSGETYWVSLAINPVRDLKGVIQKYIAVQANITETKKASLDFRYKLDAIGRSNAILELDTNCIILEANANFLKLFGYSLDEIVGRHHNIFLDKAHLAGHDYKLFCSKLAKGNFISDEFSRVTKSGEVIWLKGIYNPILDMNGNLSKIVKFAVDITSEKRLQIEGQRKQAELDSYLTAINNTIATAEFDLAGNFISANDIFLKIMGYTPTEIKAQNYSSFMIDVTSSQIMWENLRVGKFFSGEFKMRDKFGKEIWLNGTFNPIFIESNIPEKVMMCAQFTTLEKEKLNDLNVMVNALKSSLPIVEFNDQFKCKVANDKFLKMFNVSRLDLRNKTIYDFLDSGYVEVFDNMKLEILKKESSALILPIQVEGMLKTFEASISITRNSAGELSRVILIFVKELEQRIPVLAAVR